MYDSTNQTLVYTCSNSCYDWGLGCNPMDCSTPGSSVHKDSPGKNTGVGCMPSSWGSSQPRSPALQADSLPSEPPGKPKNTGVRSLSLLQGIFPTQESNWGFPHCKQILYQLTYQESPSWILGFIMYYIRFENIFSILQVVQTFLITSFDAHNLRFWWILSSLSILSIYLFLFLLFFYLHFKCHM